MLCDCLSWRVFPGSWPIFCQSVQPSLSLRKPLYPDSFSVTVVDLGWGQWGHALLPPPPSPVKLSPKNGLWRGSHRFHISSPPDCCIHYCVTKATALLVILTCVSLNAGADPGFLTGSATTQRRSNLLFGIIFAENWVKMDPCLLMRWRIQDFPDGGANPTRRGS